MRQMGGGAHTAFGATARTAAVLSVVCLMSPRAGATAAEPGLTARYLALPPTPLPGLPAVAIRQIAASLYIHESHDARGVPSNGLVAVLGGGLLLVDTAWTDEQTARILDWGERTLGRKWIGAVITHEHADRDGGLGTVLARKIPVAALDFTVDRLEKRGVHGVAPLFAAGARAGSRAFQDPRGFEAFFPGPGHAPDNVVLWFPAQQVLFGGCLIKSASADSLGFTGDADLAAWPEAVRRVAGRYHPILIVPGHGPIALGDAALRHTLDLLATKTTK